MKQVVRHPLLGDITLCRRVHLSRITLSVTRDGGLRLSVPYGISASRAIEFAESRAEWIRQARQRQRQYNPEVEYSNGMRTRNHILQLTPSSGRRVTVSITETRAIVRYPADTEKQIIQKAARRAYTEALRAEAAEFLPARLKTLADEHGFKYGSLRIKAMRSKWGSCTSRSDINLSLYLMILPDALIDFVMLHELCHTVHHNHSQEFHALLDRVLNGREKELSTRLRKFHPPV